MIPKPEYSLVNEGPGCYRIRGYASRVLFTLFTQTDYEPFEMRRFLYAGSGDAENLIGFVDAEAGETLEDSVRKILRSEAAFLIHCAEALK